MGGVILVACVIVWALNYFPRHESADKTQQSEQIDPSTDSYLEMIGKAVNPVMEPLGFHLARHRSCNRRYSGKRNSGVDPRRALYRFGRHRQPRSPGSSDSRRPRRPGRLHRSVCPRVSGVYPSVLSVYSHSDRNRQRDRIMEICCHIRNIQHSTPPGRRHSLHIVWHCCSNHTRGRHISCRFYLQIVLIFR